MHSSQTRENGGKNDQMINVPEIDAIGDKSLVTVDDATQNELGRQNQDLIAKYVVYIPLHYWMDVLLVSPSVTGWDFNIISGPLWNVATWEFAPAAN
jgi:ABC-type transport system substrate-binding protein